MTSFQSGGQAAREAGEAWSAQIAAEVRAEMARQGKSKGELAHALGVTLNTAKSRYDGTHPYDMVELALIAIWLDVDMRDFAKEAS